MAAERETLEESGYQVRAEKLLALLDKARHEHPPSLDYTYKVLIGCRLEGGEARTSHEVDDVGFFAEERSPRSTSTWTAPPPARWPSPSPTTATPPGPPSWTDAPVIAHVCSENGVKFVSRSK